MTDDTAAPELTTLDAAFLLVEGPAASMAIGSVGIFEGGPLLDGRGRLRLADMRAHVEARLHRMPQLRRKVAWVPFGLARPRWIGDPDFDVRNHVEEIHLGGDATDEELRTVAARLFAEPLPRDRPLWHLCFVSGLDGGRVASVERIHHAMVDGVSGVDAAVALLDLEPDPGPVVPPSGASAGKPVAPSPGALVAEAAREEVSAAFRRVGGMVRFATSPAAVADTARAVAGTIRALADGGLKAPASSLNVAVGERRRFEWVPSDLDDVKAAGAARGATVNDVILTGVAGGLRALFLARGEEVAEDAVLKALVPVSTRPLSARGTLGNQVGALLANLPVGMADPSARLDAVAATTRGLKASGEAQAASLVTGALDLLPLPLARHFAPTVHGQGLINLVVTNVPGPQFPLYAMGARLLEAYPVVPLVGNTSVGVAVFSYDGAVNIGLNADPDVCPDLGVLAAGIRASFAELGVGDTRRAIDAVALAAA